MQIIVAHPSPIAATRLKRGLVTDPAITSCETVSGLTETYNMAEHRHPDCVVIAVALAALPEFELLSSLLKIMGIGCVILGQAGPEAETPPALRRARHIVRVPEHADATAVVPAIAEAQRHAPRPTMPRGQSDTARQFDPKSIILIAASTGGIDALLKTVAHFPQTAPPTLIVQHTGENFAPSLIKLLDGATAARVGAAEDGGAVQPGHIYLSPHNRAHLCLTQRGGLRIMLQPGDLVSGHRPSADMLFRSARGYARHVTAAILTGMGRDGASGLLELRRAGAQTFGQDAATSVVYGMPRVAMEMGGVGTQLPLSKIGPALLSACQAKVRI